MEYKDLLEAKALLNNDGHGLSQYEQIKVGNMQRKTSGTAIAGLCVGIGAAVATVGVAAWATAKAGEARRVASAENAGTAALLNRVARQFEIEHSERVNGDITLNQTITDTISGQQSTTQSQQLSNEIALGVMTGEYERRPQRVALYRDQQACDCPGSCGCGGR
jgi:hypothetical protein